MFQVAAPVEAIQIGLDLRDLKRKSGFVRVYWLWRSETRSNAGSARATRSPSASREGATISNRA